MPSDTTQVPIIIIGGGIVGLSATLFLSHHGIQSLLVERHSGTNIHPRARSINARTVELYRSLGLEDAVRVAGVAISASKGIYSGSSLREVIEAKPRSGKPRKFPFAGLLEGISPVTGTFVTQDLIEPVLLEAARERGVDLRFSTECVGVEQASDGVIAKLKGRETGTTSTVHAHYLIAADGAGSPIRTRLDIPTKGCGIMGYLLNILFHADLQSLVLQREFLLCKIDRPEVSGLFASINNSDRWVFQLSYDPAKGEKAEDFPPERCKELLRLAIGIPGLEIDIKSILPWQPTVRVADHMQRGRIFLAGDAAHQMPPWAGQGANSGIADVHNLAWKLAAVLKSHANPLLLETYNLERLSVGRAAAEISASAADEKGIISTKMSLALAASLSGRLKIISGHGYVYTSESKAICAEERSLLGGMTWWPWTLASLGLSIDGRPGSRAPHLWVSHQGSCISTVDLFGKTFVLLAGEDGGTWVEAARQVSSTLNIEIVGYSAGLQGDFMIKKGSFESAAGISSRGAILVRPDGFVAWRQRRQPPDPHTELEVVIRQVLFLQ